jgi:hypothetical protein
MFLTRTALDVLYGSWSSVFADPAGSLPIGLWLRVRTDEGAHLDHDSVIPLPRVSPENGPVRVVGVESEPMTAEQQTAAVRALARMIATWMENHPDHARAVHSGRI